MTLQPALNATGVPGLDLILGGGVARTDLIFIVGPPGAGKTVLGSQMVFSAARSGTPTLILTAHSEGHVKLLEHLRSFAFYDETVVGRQVQLLALQTLIATDPVAIAMTIARTIIESRARLVLIDGFQGIQPLLPESEGPRRLMAALSTQLSYLKTTILVTLAGDARDPMLIPELTTSDVIIGLTYTTYERRHWRMLEVLKQRGRAQLSGQHTYKIDATGITVFPQLEAYPVPVTRPRPGGRRPFGIPELDQMLGGGVNAGTNTILAGAPGTGKTTLALSWALATTPSEAKTVYVSFREHDVQLEEKAAAFGLDLRSARQSGAIDIIRFNPTELNPDFVAQQLLEAIRDADTCDLIVDDVNILMNALGARGPAYVSALAEHLYGAGVTSLGLLEIDPFAGFRLNLTSLPAGILAENLVIVQQHEAGATLRRKLAVLRMRYSDHDRTVRELVLDRQGVRVRALEETRAAHADEDAAGDDGTPGDSEAGPNPPR